MQKNTTALFALLLFSFALSVTGYSQANAPSGYASLTHRLDAGYCIATNGSLHFLFEEEYYVPANTSLPYKILDAANKPVTNPAPLTVQQGFNKYELNVSALQPGYYVLEVSNAKKEKWYLRFKIA